MNRTTDRVPPGPCPACGEEALRPWRVARSSDPELSRSTSYELLRCERCGSATLADPTEEPAELYTAGAYSAPAGGWRPVIRSWRRLITWDRRRLLGELPPASRVLEIGSGRGELLAALAAEGHRVSGAEPAAAVGRASLGRGVAVSDLPLERLEQQPASLDRIVLWHVLEHLDEPREALERVRPWLAPGGRLIVAVPNLGSLQAAIGGDRWFHQDVPRHRTQFTAGGLGQLIHRTGFEPRRRPRPLMDQNPLGMWLTLLNRLTTDSNVPFRLVKRTQGHEAQASTVRDVAVTALAGPLLLVPAVVAELVATARGRGGSLVVEAAPSSE